MALLPRRHLDVLRERCILHCCEGTAASEPGLQSMALAWFHFTMPSVVFGCGWEIRSEACVPAAGLLLWQTALLVDVVPLARSEESEADSEVVLAADSVV
jgi:hypothetical protein